MSTYVMSDIHGCYDDLQTIMEIIGFSADDRLMIAGDCIDRGSKTYEMLNAERSVRVGRYFSQNALF